MADAAAANARIRRARDSDRFVPDWPSSSALFHGFESKYDARGFADGTSPAALGPAGSYDSVYLLAYAAVALGGQLSTGPKLAEALGALVPQDGAVRVDVGTNNINSSFNLLATGGKIDFAGASGPLDFDIRTGEAPSDIQIWCIPKNAADKADSAQSSGRYLDASSMELRGTTDPRCR